MLRMGWNNHGLEAPFFVSDTIQLAEHPRAKRGKRKAKVMRCLSNRVCGLLAHILGGSLLHIEFRSRDFVRQMSVENPSTR